MNSAYPAAEGLPAGARLRVTAGSPSPEETVAVLLALDLALADERRGKARPTQLSRWRRAARLEAIGDTGLGAPRPGEAGMGPPDLDYPGELNGARR
ncbi:MAG: hypothetical protein GEU81_04925 [Nitriliruptorales bacterium]|nr:hypothetical protein [Nitriliruptorales bacterium]